MECLPYPQNDTYKCVCKENTANSDLLGVTDCESKQTPDRRSQLLHMARSNPDSPTTPNILCVWFIVALHVLFAVKATCGGDLVIGPGAQTHGSPGFKFASPGKAIE